MKNLLCILPFLTLSLNLQAQDTEEYIKRSNELDYEFLTTLVKRIDRLEKNTTQVDNKRLDALEIEVQELKLDKRMLIELNNVQADLIKELQARLEYVEVVNKKKADILSKRISTKD